tara:strand:- start:1520 stop:2314 length:795 start_codon:yes stop_codon:yes gene_type:complete
MSKKINSAIVFDLDETLGYFSQSSELWNLLKTFFNDTELNVEYLYSIFDLFPEIFRSKIFKILKMVKKKKQLGYCDYVMIYTNNNGPDYWVNYIKDYIHKKLKYNLFDQIIRAYKIKGKHIELCRTSHEKSYSDFLSCTKLPDNTKICFIDDVKHNHMYNKNVKYIYINPYRNYISFEIFCEKFFNKNKNLFISNKKKYNDFFKFINNNISQYDNEYSISNNIEKNINLLVYKKIYENIDKFIKNKNKYTRRKKKYNHNHSFKK